MQYNYKGQNNGKFDIIDTSALKFNSSLLDKDCYKIIWANGNSCTLEVDGYRVLLEENHLLFVSPLNNLSFEIENKSLVVYAFNREFLMGYL